MTNPVEGGMSGGLEGCEEAIQVPERDGGSTGDGGEETASRKNRTSDNRVG